MRNPFTNRGMIQDPEEFFGRAETLDMLLARTVEVSKPQSCSIVGPRKIGKSSLLWRFAHMPLEGGDADSTLRIFVDLQASQAKDGDRLFLLLRKRLLRRLPPELRSVLPPIEEDAPAASFEELMEVLAEEGRRVVFLMDEFDKITGNPAFDVSVFSTLRYLANSLPMALVTSSVRDLKELCHHQDIRESPFFNIFTSKALGSFERPEAEDLLLTLSSRAGRPCDEEQTDALIDLAGTHPFFLQVAGSRWWELRDEPEALERVREAFLREAEPHFEYVVGHLEPQERQALYRLIEEDGYEPDMTTRRRLVMQSVVVRAGESLRPFSDGFRRYLRDRAEMERAEGRGSLSSGDSEEAGGAQGTQTAHIHLEELDPTRSLETGEVLEGRYELREQLGKGGFGVVFSARDLKLDRTVAVKVLYTRNRSESEEKRRERFHREARTLAKMSHPHVITVLDVGRQQDLDYLVMEYFDGAPLATLIGRRGPLQPEEGREVMRQAAAGLAHAHERGIIHRDVTPGNIMQDSSGHVKVLDFGIAFDEGVPRMTSRGMLLFNPCYCAPERLREGAASVDGRADIFSWACVAFELLVGERLYKGRTMTEVLSKILTRTPPVERVGDSGLPEPWQNLLLACLAAEPEDRVESCERLLEGLERLG